MYFCQIASYQMCISGTLISCPRSDVFILLFLQPFVSFPILVLMESHCVYSDFPRLLMKIFTKIGCSTALVVSYSLIPPAALYFAMSHYPFCLWFMDLKPAFALCIHLHVNGACLDINFHPARFTQMCNEPFDFKDAFVSCKYCSIKTLVRSSQSCFLSQFICLVFLY